MAIEMMDWEDPDFTERPMRLLNALGAGDISPPQPASAAARAVVNKMIKNQPLFSRPPFGRTFAKDLATRHERVLPMVSAQMKFEAVDGSTADKTFVLACDECLWDSGAQCSLISADMFDAEFREFLRNDPIHDPCRNGEALTVQVSCAISLSNTTFEMVIPMIVLPVEKIPGQRSGVILGQHGFLNRLAVETMPRAILEKIDIPVGEDIWGLMDLKTFMDGDE